jgi:hypothetical protein
MQLLKKKKKKKKKSLLLSKPKIHLWWSQIVTNLYAIFSQLNPARTFMTYSFMTYISHQELDIPSGFLPSYSSTPPPKRATLFTQS